MTVGHYFTSEGYFTLNVDSKEFLTELFDAMYDKLPAPKKKK